MYHKRLENGFVLPPLICSNRGIHHKAVYDGEKWSPLTPIHSLPKRDSAIDAVRLPSGEILRVYNYIDETLPLTNEDHSKADTLVAGHSLFYHKASRGWIYCPTHHEGWYAQKLAP